MEGQRSKKEAKQYQKKLKRLESQRIKLQALGKASGVEADKYNKRLGIEFDSEKGNVITKLNERLEAKRNDKINESVMYINAASKVKKEIEKTITELTDKGYDIESKEYKAYADKGEQLIGYYLGGIPGAIIAKKINENKYTVPASQYKVRNSDDETSNHQKNVDTIYNTAKETYSKETAESMREYYKNHPSEAASLAKKYSTANSNSSDKYGGLFSNPTGVYSPKKLSRKERREREQRWQNEVQKTIDKMSQGSESDKAWAKYLSFDLDSVKNSYKRKEDYERDKNKALEDSVRLKQQENNARDKSKMPTSSGLTDSQKKAFNQAKNEDKWSIDFLEVADPDNEWSDQKMLREYKEYLKDPEGWMQRR